MNTARTQGRGLGHTVRLAVLSLAASGLAACLPMLPPIPGVWPARQPAANAAAPPEPEGVEIRKNEARIAFAGNDDFVKRRLIRSAPDRYDEVAAFEGGFVRYVALHGGATFTNPSNRAALEETLKSEWYRNQNMPSTVPSLKTGRNAQGIFEYALVTGDIGRCILVSQHFGAPGKAPDRQLRGARCWRRTDPRATSIEPDMLDRVQRVRVGPPPAVATRAQQAP